MRPNTSLATWRAGHQTIGCWLSIGHSFVAETVASLGFDWLCVDLQHGMISDADLLHMLQGISRFDVTPLVRTPANEGAAIQRALDAGAYGVIVPMVNTAAEAARAVAACRYPPDGERSYGPLRGLFYGGPDYAAEANRTVACIVMIETREGLANLEEIAATPGLDGIFIGPADLAFALGLPVARDYEHPDHKAAVAQIREACSKFNVPKGILASSHASAEAWLNDGFHFVGIGSDVDFLLRATGEAQAKARRVLTARSTG